MDFVIAIPSYKRHITLKNKTLALLSRCNIPKDIIYIFVANSEEYKLYNETFPEYPNIIIGEPGMCKIRNFMTNYFPENQKILYIDDDISDFIEINVFGKAKKEYNLLSIIREGFHECETKNCNLFGIYPVSNAFFMGMSTTFDIRYIVGCFYGVINKKNILVSLDDKEDYERTILFYLRDGGVVRINRFSPITNYYSEKGGMMETRTLERVHNSAVELCNRYPNLAKLNTGKKSGKTEIILKDTTRENKKSGGEKICPEIDGLTSEMKEMSVNSEGINNVSERSVSENKSVNFSSGGNGKIKHWVWEFFTLDGTSKAVCNICDASFNYNSRHGCSNLRNHYISRHSSEEKKAEVERKPRIHPMNPVPIQTDIESKNITGEIYDPERFNKLKTDLDILESLLKKHPLKFNTKRQNSGEGFTQTFGSIIKRFSKNRDLEECKNNYEYPEVWKILQEIGKKFVNVEWTAIQVNHNYASLKHIDKNNYGNSWIVSFGNFVGGELCLDPNCQEFTKSNYVSIVDTQYKPFIFNGSKVPHWNNEITGNKYSIIFFNIASSKTKYGFNTWDVFTKVFQNKIEGQAKCNFCDKTFDYKVKNGTSKFRRHYVSTHMKNGNENNCSSENEVENESENESEN